MGLIKKIKERKAELESEEVAITESEDPKEYSVFDRLATDFPDLVAPDSATEEEDYFKVGGEYTRTLYIHTYPPSVEDNWLREILRFPHSIDVSIYIQPIPIKPLISKMKKQVARDSASIAKQEEDGVLASAQRMIQLEQSMEFIRDMEAGDTKPYNVMVAMTLRGKSEAELDKVTEQFERRLTAITTRRTTHRHKHGFLTNLPVMNNKLKEKRLHASRGIHSQGLMSMFPFTSSELTHESGVVVGVSGTSGSPIILNRFMQPVVENPNMAIFGAAGSGKSYFAKTEMSRWAYQGVPIIVLDPSGEYVKVAEGLGGSVVDIDLFSNQVVSPLDFSSAVRPGHNALTDKVAFLWELVKMMMRTEAEGGMMIDPMTKQIFENATVETYAAYGYSMSDISTQQNAHPTNMPVLSDIWHSLETIARTNPDPRVQDRCQPLLAALSSFVGEGQLAPLFDRRTNVDMNSHFICFNYSKLPPQYLPLAMFLVMEYLRTTYLTQEQAESGIQRSIYIDEAHMAMDSPEIAKFLNWTVRTCRKYGVGMTVMTQNVGVFAHGEQGGENKEGRGILANCAVKVLLKQESTEAKFIESEFDITGAELQRLLGAGTGEGLIFIGPDATWFSSMYMASDLEHRMFSTTAQERAQFAREELTAGQPEEETYQEPFAIPEDSSPPAALDPADKAEEAVIDELVEEEELF
jgi:type IV secretory pathway VirB4 component